ncbi:hypothetical protein FHT69_002962 [Rhizobium sp. BK008]|nr:hypothetical protein [Rhizobium sp. BK008]
MEAPKAALPARPALIQQLAAIDLVFENFGFKSGGRKKLLVFGFCHQLDPTHKRLHYPELRARCFRMRDAFAVVGPAPEFDLDNQHRLGEDVAATKPQAAAADAAARRGRLSTSRTPLVRRTRIGRSVVSPKKRLFDRSGVHQMPTDQRPASSRIACGMTVFERPFHPFVPVTPSEPVNTSRRATKTLRGPT